MALGKTVFFKKLVDSSVSLYVQDVEGILPARWFVMDQKMPRIGIPVNYALSLFVDSSIEAMLKANYIEIEDMAGLIKLAEEKGYISPTEEEVKVLTAPKRTVEALFAIIKGGNTTKLEELFKSADKERALEIVTAKQTELSSDVVAKIEKILGVAISEE
jgi:hypothetical protein